MSPAISRVRDYWRHFIAIDPEQENAKDLGPDPAPEIDHPLWATIAGYTILALAFLCYFACVFLIPYPWLF